MWKVLGSILLVSACQEYVTGYRILCLFPVPIKSHFISAEKLLKSLAERGHQVDVVSHFPPVDPPPNYTHINVATAAIEIETTMSYATLLSRGKVSISSVVEINGKPVCEQMTHPIIQKLINNPPNDPPYDLVITEMFVSPCWLIIGHLLKIPTIGYVSSSFYIWLNYPSGNPLSTAYMSNPFSAYSQRMPFFQRLVNTVFVHIIIARINYYISEQDEQLKRFVGPNTPKTSDLLKNVSLYLVNQHYSIGVARPWLPTVIEVAGLHLDTNNTEPLTGEIKEFLDESKHGCVYFAFGNIIQIETFPHTILKEFYAAFENIAPIRVLMMATDKSLLPPGLPDNVMVKSWFPQLAVLKHRNTRAFITHGGISAMEALVNGVPMVSIPLFGDQFAVTKNLVNKNIAVSLNYYYELTEEKITNALNTVLNVPSYKENVVMISKKFMDRPMKPLDTAIYWIEYIGKYGYISESPGAYLTWWQQDLLDVYATLMLTAIIIVYLLLRILKVLARCAIHLITVNRKRDIANIKKTK